MAEENQTAEDPITTSETPELPEVETGAAEQATLGVADLQNAAQVIDVAVSRGAFRAAEAAQVGQVFNRLVAFIQSVQQQQNPEGAEAQADAQ
jgi:hypothetical protein